MRDAETHDPLVLRNAPVLDDGRPMPTRYWLLASTTRDRISRLEADGGVDRAEHELDPVDLLDAAGVPVAKRAFPLVAGVLVILWFLRRRSNRRKRNG